MDSVHQADPLADEEFIAKLLARVEMNAFTTADLSAHLGEDETPSVPATSRRQGYKAMPCFLIL